MANVQDLDGYITMIEERLFGGWEAYLITLMFNQLDGNEQTKQRQMLRICESVYARFLTRLIKRPHNTPIVEMPFWISCFDWPVHKKEKSARGDVLINEGMHVHAILMVPPNARTGERLGIIVSRSPEAFLIGKGKPLARLDIEPVERTVSKAALYALKQITRKRQTADEILILPRSSSEI